MKKSILVAGGTGDLGNRIIKALIKKNADVVAIVRHSSNKEKIQEMEKMGVKVMEVDMDSLSDLTEACRGVSCVVSALAGLRETIVDAQSLLLEAAIAAAVPRFVPSDFSVDITKIAEGENRNFDLRREFHEKLDNAPISGTAIMNGAFADVLAYNTPFYNLKDHSVGYWGNDPDFPVAFSTKDDTAAYTAEAALDDQSPEILHIASFQLSANQLVDMASELKNKEFKLVPMGSLASLSAYNKKEREANPEGENEPYPAWQGSQYMHSMFTFSNDPVDNDRYEHINWTSAHDVLSKI